MNGSLDYRTLSIVFAETVSAIRTSYTRQTGQRQEEMEFRSAYRWAETTEEKRKVCAFYLDMANECDEDGVPR